MTNTTTSARSASRIRFVRHAVRAGFAHLDRGLTCRASDILSDIDGWLFELPVDLADLMTVEVAPFRSAVEDAEDRTRVARSGFVPGQI